MRRIWLIIFILTVVVIFSGCSGDTTQAREEYRLIRVHIRANSNESVDQAVKLTVRDAVTEYLNGELGEIRDFETAYNGIKARLGILKTLCERTLAVSGFRYGAKVRLNHEYFPARAYQDIVVDAGYYDALIIELGEGTGDNWWCVIYPPLCYVSAAEAEGGFVYRSKIKELWDRYCAA